MLIRAFVSALAAAALACGVAWAQSPQPADDAQNLPQKIHDDLVSRGFTDVHVVPQSFLISAKDKTGKAIVMLVGPNSMTVLSAPPQSGDPNTAESRDGKDKLIQQ
jgi:hypothetical protein